MCVIPYLALHPDGRGPRQNLRASAVGYSRILCHCLDGQPAAGVCRRSACKCTNNMGSSAKLRLQSLRDRSRPLRSRFNCDRCFREHMDRVCGAPSTACDGCSSIYNPTRVQDMASCNMEPVRVGRREEKKARDARNSKATRDRKRAEAAGSD